MLARSKHKKLFRWVLFASFLSIFFVSGCSADKAELPLNGESLELQWRYESDGAINQTPLRIGDVLVFVPHDETLTALHAKTGKRLWEFAGEADVWERAFATDGKLIFVGMQGGRLAALDARSGELKWQIELGIDMQVRPLIANELLYVPTTFVGPGLDSNPEGKAKLFILDPNDGSEIWSFESDNYILQTPTLSGDTLYVGGSYYAPEIDVDEGGPMRIYALDAQSGEEYWAYESVDGFAKKLYATEDAVVYIAYQDFVTGVDAQTGEAIWRRDTGNWVPSMLGVGNTVYFGSANTVIYAYDTASGDLIWKHNIPEGTFNYVMGAPVRVQDELYMLTQHGDIMALNALDGTALWKIPTGITPRDGLIVSGGWLYFGDIDGVVYAYSD